MTNSILPPGLVLMIGALLLPFLEGHVRKVYALALPVLVLWLVWMVPDGNGAAVAFLDYELYPLEGTPVGRLFATIFGIAAGLGALYALNQKSIIELVSAYVYAGGAIGVALAGDLVTVFVFWEIMAIFSTMVIWSNGTARAWRASMRYILVHLLGGVILMIGVVGYINTTGSVDFVAMTPSDIWTWLILIGFLINAGAPPLSAWLPDAYPEASWSGMVFLSAFTTKTAVYVLWVGFPGSDVLIYVGLYMVIYGLFYALIENDMRRIMAFSIINQVGFLVCAIGIGSDLALNGAAAQAFAHILYKALLLMALGAVLYQTGKSKLTELGGLYKTMPVTCICFLIGALTISAAPLTAAFVTKTLILQATADAHMAWAWFILTAASAGSFLYAGLKLPWFVFFNKDSGLKPTDPPANMKLAMIILALMCLGLGIYPQALFGLLPFEVEYAGLKAYKVVHMLQVFLFTALAFVLLYKWLKPAMTVSLDLDWFYRVFLKKLYDSLIIETGGKLFEAFKSHSLGRLNGLVDHVFKHHGPEGILARTWPTGSMALWVVVLLGAYLLVYYVF